MQCLLAQHVIRGTVLSPGAVREFEGLVHDQENLRKGTRTHAKILYR